VEVDGTMGAGVTRGSMIPMVFVVPIRAVKRTATT
jgi:hypothetical protein